MAPRTRCLAAVVVCVAVAAPGAASDELLVSIGLDPGVGDPRSSIDALWLRSEDSGHLEAGLAYSELAGSSWLVARVGAAREVSARWRLSSSLEAGSGRKPAGEFDYRKVVASGTFTWKPGKLYAQLGSQWFDIDTASGAIAQAGLSWVVTPRVLVAAHHSFSVAGSDRVRFETVRADWTLKGAVLFLGGANGDTAPALLDPSGPGLPPTIEHQLLFAGARRSFGGRSADLVLEREEIGGRVRGAVRATLRLPLRQHKEQPR